MDRGEAMAQINETQCETTEKKKHEQFEFERECAKRAKDGRRKSLVFRSDPPAPSTRTRYGAVHRPNGKQTDTEY